MAKHAYDTAFGFCVALLGIAYAYSASLIPISLLSDAVGPGGMPIALGLIVATLGALLAVRSALVLVSTKRRGISSPEDGDAPSASAAAHLKGVFLLLIGVAYIFVAPVLGYFISILLLIGATARLAGARISWRYFLVSFCIAAVLTLVFVTVVHTPQPEGVFHSLLPRLGF